MLSYPIKELSIKNLNKFKKFMRVSTDEFNFLVEQISPLVSRRDPNMWKAIPVGERLAMTLRYLATGVFLLNR